MDDYFAPIMSAAQLQQTQQQTKFAKQEQPYHMQILQNQARQSGIKTDEMLADQLALTLASEKIRAAAASGQQMTPVQALEIGVSELASAGRVSTAGQLLDRVELAKSREARQEVLDAHKKKLQYAEQTRELELLSNVLADVKDQAGLDIAAQIYEAELGKPVPPEYKVYSPELIRSLQNATISGKMRLQKQIADDRLEQQRKAEANREAERRRKAGEAGARQELASRRLEIAEERERRLKKEGGGAAGKGSATPSRVAVEHATSVARKFFPGLSGDDLESVSFDIAADAVAEAKRSGADLKSAIYAAAQRASGGVKAEKPHILSKEKPVYKGAGATLNNPLPMPATKDQLIPGRYYKDSTGEVRLWKGD